MSAGPRRRALPWSRRVVAEVAYHEAGHAVIFAVHGLQVARVALDADGGWCAVGQDAGAGIIPSSLAIFRATGRVVPDEAPPGGDWIALALGRLAGPIAAAHHAGRPYRWVDSWHDRLAADLTVAAVLDAPASTAPVQEIMIVLERVAAREVVAYWPWIARVAAALLRRDLVGADVVALRVAPSGPVAPIPIPRALADVDRYLTAIDGCLGAAVAALADEGRRAETRVALGRARVAMRDRLRLIFAGPPTPRRSAARPHL